MQVTFNVSQDRRTNQFFARNIAVTEKATSTPPLTPSTTVAAPAPAATTTTAVPGGAGAASAATGKRHRGVISTMKDSFGFIEREDVLKEIFFHITEFGPHVATNAIHLGVEVEFDIQNRHVSHPGRPSHPTCTRMFLRLEQRRGQQHRHSSEGHGAIRRDRQDAAHRTNISTVTNENEEVGRRSLRSFAVRHRGQVKRLS